MLLRSIESLLLLASKCLYQKEEVISLNWDILQYIFLCLFNKNMLFTWKKVNPMW